MKLLQRASWDQWSREIGVALASARKMPQVKKDPYTSIWNETLTFVSKELGVKATDLKRSVIPSWLDVPSGDQQSLDDAVDLLASALRVPSERLSGRISPLVATAECRCKGATQEKIDSQRPARNLAEALGRHLVSVLDEENETVCETAASIRKRLLSEAKLIDLESLLNVCWSMNVPVAHLAQPISHAPHAVAMNVQGRCAIVLLRNHKHQGWHLFDLAHELGHIMLGHVRTGEVIVEGEGMSLVDDAEEKAANEFAFELLAGTSNLGNHAHNANQLLAKCKLDSWRYHVDAQWLVVCSGTLTKNWGATQNALKLGWPTDDALGVIEKVLAKQLLMHEVSRSRSALIQKMAVRPKAVA